MNNIALKMAWVLVIASSPPASAIDVWTNPVPHAAGAATRHPELAIAPVRLMMPASQRSALPEPEVFAMMLVGLVLIGHRTSRNSDEKFQ